MLAFVKSGATNVRPSTRTCDVPCFVAISGERLGLVNVVVVDDPPVITRHDPLTLRVPGVPPCAKHPKLGLLLGPNSRLSISIAALPCGSTSPE